MASPLAPPPLELDPPPVAPEFGTDDDPRLPTRLAWITGLRLGLLTLLLVTIAIFYLRGAIGGYPKSQGIVFTTIGTAYALAAVYATVLRSGKRLRRLAEAQIVLDQLTWTAIVYVSGGATSGATSFYGLTCLVGAILIGLRGAALAAVSGFSIFLALCAAFAFGWIRPPADQGAANYVVDWPNMVYPLAVNALGIVVVSLLAGYLADRLRRAGGAIREANERALAAERLALLGRIAAGLAHEIRNPLGSISGSIEMLRDAPGLTDDDKRLCDIVHGEAARLNNLVSDMMDLARPKKPEPEDVDVASLAREVVALASRSERSGSGDVAVAYRGPEGAILARCDPGQMRQVLWNLVRNAVQASGAGTAVLVEVEADDKRVRMSVSDEGPGVSKEAAEKIFDAFYTTRSHGAGIGLAVVRRIIDDHATVGASIEVKDRPGPKHGATFVVGLARAHSSTVKAKGGDHDRAITPPANARSRTA
ncbi:MAG: HAMP domain-containing histidine kinase [Deltaproteobacteria bacterium]|nr:HAMP domain-containing histidine kinase [Deltaproteobacteria bacterium]